MTILEVQILHGEKDSELLDLIRRLEYIKDKKDGGNGLSPREQVTLDRCYERLELITK